MKEKQRFSQSLLQQKLFDGHRNNNKANKDRVCIWPMLRLNRHGCEKNLQ